MDQRATFVLLLIVLIASGGDGAHLSGTFQPADFFKFIVKFGFQQSERHALRDTFGYVYGNITAAVGQPNLTLVVVDADEFPPFYGNRTLYDKTQACEMMFARLQHNAFDRRCTSKATGDFLRLVPCPYGQLCADEDDATNVVPGNQFTYTIGNLAQPRFWYVSLVACYRDAACKWQHYTGNASRAPVSYDMRLVQGQPNRSGGNPLTYQFSFDQQYILEMNLVFFCVYVFLVPLQLYAVRIQKHPVTKLFTLSLVLEFVSLVLILWHLIRFAAGGVGNEFVRTTGDVLDIFSRTSFMLILLLLAKGWAVTRQQVSRSGWLVLLAIWIPYCAFHVVLYVWNRTEVDVIDDIDEYQTWPGKLVLVCRTSFMLWFLYELRNTMRYEHSTKKLDFLLHFGASSLVWFIYLPVVAIVALQVSPMWRCKLLLGITNSADCLAYCVMTGLLWPNRSGQYLLLAGTNINGMDELDELNEAPQIVRGDVPIGHDALDEGRSTPPVDDRKRPFPEQLLHSDDDTDEDVVLMSTDNLPRRVATNHTIVPNQAAIGAPADSPSRRPADHRHVLT